MNRLRAWAVRLRNLFRKSRLEKDLAAELHSNLHMEIEDNLRSGMSPLEARRRALAKFGSLDSVREQCRDRRGIPFVEAVARDARYALRTLRQNKGWTAVAVLSLALGIGVNTAVFSVVNSVMLQTLPVRNPRELIALRAIGENTMLNGRSGYGYIAPDSQAANVESRFREATFSFGLFQQLSAQSRPLAELFAFAYTPAVNVVAGGQAELASSQFVSGNFYRELGIAPFRGRMIEPEDDSAGADPVAVISHDYWQRRFAMNPAVVGSTVTINTVPFTIVGITPPDFGSAIRTGSVPEQVSVPLAMEPLLQRNQSRLNQPANWWLVVMGRLKPDASREQLQAALEGVYDRTVRDEWNQAVAGMSPQRRASPQIAQHEDRIPQLRVVHASRGVYDVAPQESLMLALLAGIVGMVLLLVCVNLANLLFSRGAMREKEIAVRLAIGASRGRVIRQLLTESLVLGGIGGAVGLLLAYWCRTLFPVWMGFRPVNVDWAVLGFTVAVTFLTGIVFGLLPAFRATRIGFAPARPLIGKSLLVAQVAISMVLLIGAGLFLGTLRNLRGLDVGFNTDKLVLFGVNPAANQYDPVRTAALFDRILEQLAATPGVRSVALSSTALLTGSNSGSPFGVEGRSERVLSNVLSVDHNYFDTLEIPLKSGRGFTPRDNQTAPRVAIVNEKFVKNFMPGLNPIGMHLETPTNVGNVQVEIVGVVADARFATLREDPPPTVYMPHPQRPTSRFFAVRTAGEAAPLIPAIRDAMRSIDPNLPLQFISTQSESIERLLTREKTFAASSSLLGALALVISMIGLFGLMSYTVGRRTKEIGIRMALGAGRRAVLRSVLGETMAVVVIGIVAGFGAALALTRLIASQLFGLGANDPLTILLAVVLMIQVALLAGYLPARRASRVDPLVALRYE